MRKDGMDNKFMICLRSMYPANVMNTSPTPRPSVPMSVARRPELRVPVANAVGITLLRTDPTTPSNACSEQKTITYPEIYLLGPTAKEWS